LTCPFYRNVLQNHVRPGFAMVMDKGLSQREAEDLVSISSDYTDYVKLGFGTSIVTREVQKKIDIYKQGSIKVYLEELYSKHLSSVTVLTNTGNILTNWDWILLKYPMVR